MIERLTEYIARNFERYKTQIHDSSKNLSYIIWGDNNGFRGFVTVQYFSSGKPLVTAKFTRDRNSIKIRREYENLTKLEAMVSGAIKNTIPRALELIEWEHDILLQTSFGGTTAANRLYNVSRFAEKRFVTKVAMRAVLWLQEFQGKTMSKDRPDREVFAQLKNQLKKHLTDRNICELNLDEFLSGPDTHEKLITVPVHGNFCPDNMILCKDGLKMVNWTDFDPHGLPFMDILDFITRMGFELNRKHNQSEESFFRYTFCDDNWFSRLAKASVYHYLDAVSIPRKMLNIFLPIYFLRRGQSENIFATDKVYDFDETELWSLYLENRGDIALT